MIKTLAKNWRIVDDFPSRWWVGGCIFLVRARGPGFQGQAGAAGLGARAGPGPACAPKNAATNPPPRREIIDDSSIFGQSFNHTPNHNLNHNSNHNLNMFPVCSFRPVAVLYFVIVQNKWRGAIWCCIFCLCTWYLSRTYIIQCGPSHPKTKIIKVIIGDKLPKIYFVVRPCKPTKN